jgi:hypothetical protein
MDSPKQAARQKEWDSRNLIPNKSSTTLSAWQMQDGPNRACKTAAAKRLLGRIGLPPQEPLILAAHGDDTICVRDFDEHRRE